MGGSEEEQMEYLQNQSAALLKEALDKGDKQAAMQTVTAALGVLDGSPISTRRRLLGMHESEQNNTGRQQFRAEMLSNVRTAAGGTGGDPGALAQQAFAASSLTTSAEEMNAESADGAL